MRNTLRLERLLGKLLKARGGSCVVARQEDCEPVLCLWSLVSTTGEGRP